MPPLLLLSLAWVAGVGAGLWYPAPRALAITALCALPIVFFARRRFSAATIIYACLIVVLLGSVRHQTHRATLVDDPFAGVSGQQVVQLAGIVSEAPQVSDTTARWRMDVRAFRTAADQEWQVWSGKLLVYTRWTEPLRYGDEVQVEGKLQAPARFNGFDYAEYLLHQDIHRIVRYPQVAVVASDKGNPVMAALLGVRTKLAVGLQRALPEPQSALSQGILLGIRSSIPKSVADDFQRTATTHILAISGQNLSVVAILLALGGTRLFGRGHWAFLVGLLLAVWTYTVLVGFSPSVVRSAIMASFGFVAAFSGRRMDIVQGLAMSAALMTLIDPLVLLDLGFQLSFLSLTGIVAIVPLLGRLGERFPVPETLHPVVRAVFVYVGVALTATLGATLATLPVQAINFHTVPFTAVPTTLFAIPVLPVILLGSLPVAVVGMVFPPLAAILAAPVWLSSTYMLNVVHWWAQVPGANLTVPRVHPVWGFVYLAALFTLVWAAYRWLERPSTASTPVPKPFRMSMLLPTGLRRQDAFAWSLVTLLALGDLGLAANTAQALEQRVSIRFMSLAGGTATLIETSGGHRALIDGGAAPGALLDQLGKQLPFWDRHIDLLVLTGTDKDHLAGPMGVLNRYQVAATLEPARIADDGAYAQWRQLRDQHNAQLTKIVPGMRVTIRDATIEVLSASDAGSTVMKLTAYGQTMLLAGQPSVLQQATLVAERRSLSSSVLHLTDDGKSTLVDEFLDATGAKAVVVTGSTKQHPSPDSLTKLDGLTVLRSDLDGAIEVVLRPDGIMLQGERVRPRPPT